MAEKKMKVGIDFQLNDDGTATARANAIDKAGLDLDALPAGTSTPAWTSSDAGVVVTQDLAADPTGLTAQVTPSAPPVKVQDAVLTVTATLPDGTTVIEGKSENIDVVADPNAIAGFRVALA